MFKKYGLNRLSLQLMELLWSMDKPLSYEEIITLVKSKWGKNWKTRKLKSCLVDLQKAGAIIIDETIAIHIYCAACTKGEFIDNWKKEQIKNYLNEPSRLYGIFPTTKKMSKEDIEELRKLL
ncbi:BlaI/MecI/CopY family transcriptional regulator [Otoolea muris]|uniref:BlaI/MecI/CopY family transcriptional regulator n=1 Tax=Otoolea muris TaxID=2941515 RepID=UPI00203C8E35|nr:BlaI/MecI/CopY family transcriptional regulator [Otoolea muris]